MRVHRWSAVARAMCLAVVALACVGATAQPQPYPSKPIRLVVPSPPGGGTDTLSRVMSNKLGQMLQWQWVIDNKPGAGGNLGLDAAIKSAPDGYTLVMGESSNLTINPFLYDRLPFDPAKDLAPIALVGTVPLVLVVSAERPWASLAALVDAAKHKQVVFASSGNGTVGHLVGEMWKRAAGVDLLHVPYKGAGPVMTDLIGGQVDLHFASLPAAMPHVKSGKLRALAITATERSAQLPDVPTLIEAGYPGFDAYVIYGLLAPAGTPGAVIARLNTEVNHALQASDVRAAMAASGVDVRGGTADEQFGTFLDNERVKWSRAVKASGAKVE